MGVEVIVGGAQVFGDNSSSPSRSSGEFLPSLVPIESYPLIQRLMNLPILDNSLSVTTVKWPVV